jgi:hypothetical protein
MSSPAMDVIVGGLLVSGGPLRVARLCGDEDSTSAFGNDTVSATTEEYHHGYLSFGVEF